MTEPAAPVVPPFSDASSPAPDTSSTPAPTPADVQANPALAAVKPAEPTVDPAATPVPGQPVDPTGAPASTDPNTVAAAPVVDAPEAPVVTTEAGQRDDDGRELAPRVLLPAEVAERDLVAATKPAPVVDEKPADEVKLAPVAQLDRAGDDPGRD